HTRSYGDWSSDVCSSDLLAHHLRVFDPARRFVPQDRAVAAAFNRVFNETILKSLRLGRLVFPLTLAGRARGPRHSQDFIGLNYRSEERRVGKGCESGVVW